MKKEQKHTEEQPITDVVTDQPVAQNTLVPTETYLKTGIHVGTKFRTKHMQPFIYKTRSDGLSVLNVQLIDERLRMMIDMLKQYAPEDILIVCRRENGWKPVTLLQKLTGMRCFAGRYPPGILTNTDLETFVEVKIVVVVDSWADRNAIHDAMKVGIPVIALCDTNNLANDVDFVVPANNKGRKSLGLIFYLLAREFVLARGKIKSEDEMQFKIADFLEE